MLPQLSFIDYFFPSFSECSNILIDIAKIIIGMLSFTVAKDYLFTYFITCKPNSGQLYVYMKFWTYIQINAMSYPALKKNPITNTSHALNFFFSFVKQIIKFTLSDYHYHDSSPTKWSGLTVNTTIIKEKDIHWLYCSNRIISFIICTSL